MYPNLDSLPPIVDAGSGPAAGIYVLRMAVTAPLSVVFGRFAGGQPIIVQSGQYLYIGSALNARCAPSLAHRILRHLTRTDSLPPQFLRDQVAAHFAVAPPTDKRLRWHIDYLLDHPQVQVDQIVALRAAPGPQFMGEAQLADHLNGLARCKPVFPGLGAGDHPGSTHLLAWCGTLDQWQQTLAQLVRCPQQWAANSLNHARG